MEGAALGIILAIWASADLNVGKGMQKWKVKVWGHKKEAFTRKHLPDLLLWCCGLLLTASAVPLLSLATKFTDKSSMVSAMNGVGIIGLTLFAWIVLKEKIGWQELLGAALVISGSVIMGWFDVKVAGGSPYVLNRFLAVFGSCSGFCVGTAMILARMALVKSGNDFLGQLSNPYPYFAVILGVAATVFSNVAFWRARAMVVIPTFNSVVMLSPLVIEFFTFGVTLQPLQYVGVLTSVGGVILLTATEKQDRIEGVKPIDQIGN